MVRLGLLQCDSLDRPHRDVDGDYDTLYRALLARPGVEVVVYRADHGQLPSSLHECDTWIIPGSRESVYDETIAWILGLRRLVARLIESEQRVVGVCFGHQMVGLELGAEVAKAPGGWNVGAIEYQIHRPPPGESDLLCGAGPRSISGDRTIRDETSLGGPSSRTDRFRLIASHQDQVLELPPGAELLASAPTCPIAGTMVADRVLTIQGHPEFGPGVATSLFEGRVERLGAEVVSAALASLDAPLDRPRVADWIIDFARA